jgi:hypothetical protein
MDPSQVTRDDQGVMACRECGFRYTLTPAEIVERSDRGVVGVRDAVTGVPVAQRGIRPSPEVWSVNAYSAHLADAAGVITERARAIAEQDRPPLPYHDQDRAVEEGRADEQDAEVSLRQLDEAVNIFRSIVLDLRPEQWDRVGIHARAGEVNLREIAHDLPHELEHHAMDIRRIGTVLAEDDGTCP